MDIMDIQAVESKLSDVTVTPIPRSQLQNFYNYQQQREQREQQPQIQISAIHTPRDRHHHQQQQQQQSQSHHLNGNVERETTSLRDLFTNNNKRNEYQAAQLTNNSGAPSNSVTSAAVAAAALQYTQQLQAQLALLQQQVNQAAGSTTPSITLTPAVTVRPTINSNNVNYNHINNITNNCTTNHISANSQYQKYPQSTSPVILTTQTSSHINTPVATNANLAVTPNIPNLNNGLSKYAQLLAIIEEMGRDIRPTYTGSRTSTERLKRGIVHARVLVRECLLETERSARQ